MWGSMMRLTGCAIRDLAIFCVHLVLGMRAKTEREKGNWLTCSHEIPWFYGDGSWESYGLKSSRYGNSVLSRTRRKSCIGLLISAPNNCSQWICGCVVFIIKAFKFIYFCTWKQVFQKFTSFVRYGQRLFRAYRKVTTYLRHFIDNKNAKAYR